MKLTKLKKLEKYILKVYPSSTHVLITEFQKIYAEFAKGNCDVILIYKNGSIERLRMSRKSIRKILDVPIYNSKAKSITEERLPELYGDAVKTKKRFILKDKLEPFVYFEEEEQ